MILPTSYHVTGMNLDKSRPHVSEGFVDIWKVRMGGDELSVKGFRVQKSEDLDKVKQVCDIVTMRSRARSNRY